MSRLCLSLTVAALAASLTCGVALSQSTSPAPNAALRTQASSEPSTAAKVGRKSWSYLYDCMTKA